MAASGTGDATTREAIDTRTRLKEAARALFAERGIEFVSVRDIVAAAGQRNIGSLNYYFGSKEGLIAELAIEAVRGVDAERNRLLDALEAEGGPRDVREVMRVLTAFLAPPAGGSAEEIPLRFITMVMLTHQDIYLDALNPETQRGYWRCADHIARLLPQVPETLMRQRLLLMPLYMAAALATREAARERSRAWDALWRSPAALDNVIDTAIGLLAQPASPETLARLPG